MSETDVFANHYINGSKNSKCGWNLFESMHHEKRGPESKNLGKTNTGVFMERKWGSYEDQNLGGNWEGRVWGAGWKPSLSQEPRQQNFRKNMVNDVKFYGEFQRIRTEIWLWDLAVTASAISVKLGSMQESQYTMYLKKLSCKGKGIND